MKRRILIIGALGALALVGCKKDVPVREVTVEEAVRLHAAGALFVDANTDDFRKAKGKLPGAVLLDSSSQYDVNALLPKQKDRPLIFYCTSKS